MGSKEVCEFSKVWLLRGGVEISPNNGVTIWDWEVVGKEILYFWDKGSTCRGNWGKVVGDESKVCVVKLTGYRNESTVKI